MRIKIPTFRTFVDVYVGKKERPAFRRMARKSGCQLDLPDPCTEDNFFGEVYAGVIWLEKVNKTPRVIGNVVHEVVHAIDNLCESRGIKPPCETYAYLVEYIVTEIYRRLT